MKVHQRGGGRQVVEIDGPKVKVALTPTDDNEHDYQLCIQCRKPNGFYGNRLTINLSDLEDLESLHDALGALYGKEARRLRAARKD